MLQRLSGVKWLVYFPFSHIPFYDCVVVFDHCIWIRYHYYTTFQFSLALQGILISSIPISFLFLFWAYHVYIFSTVLCHGCPYTVSFESVPSCYTRGLQFCNLLSFPVTRYLWDHKNFLDAHCFGTMRAEGGALTLSHQNKHVWDMVAGA